MNFLIDESINELLKLSLEDFKKYNPETVADALAFELMKNAMGDGGIKAIQIIADRSSGRAVTVKKDFSEPSDLAQRLKNFLGE